MKWYIIIALALFIIGIGVYAFSARDFNVSSTLRSKELTSETRAVFVGGSLTTNMSVHSIEIKDILDGGPGKDGIPALDQPTFTTIEKADSSITDDVDGIFVVVGKSARFYPYNIIVWHEIVNDTVNGTPLVVTFCPLCGSAIVYDANVDGKREVFGVSGKLYNSNLLMYDKTTESLWSQVQGEAVVGDLVGAKLTLYPSQVISFKTLREKYPQAQVLSADTGYRRDYSFYPYGEYDSSQTLYFPVSVNDTRLFTKEIMHVVNFNDHSIAFKVKDLKPGIIATADVSGKKLIGKLIDGEILITAESGERLPGYTTMWFAWAVHHQKDGIVWTAEKQS